MAEAREIRAALNDVKTALKSIKGEADALSDLVDTKVSDLRKVIDLLGAATKQARTTAEGETAEVADVFAERLEKVMNIVLLEDTVNDAKNSAASAARELQQDLRSLKRDADDAITATMDDLTNYKDATIGRLGDLETFVVEELTEKMEQALTGVLEKLKQQIADIPKEVLGIVEGVFSNTLESLKSAALEKVTDVKERVGRLTEDLKDMAEAEGRKIFEEQIKVIGEEVIAKTLQEVVDDVMITQMSAQLTGMLSGYLPQLVVGKNVVGAVRRALEIMRAGF